MPLLDLINNRLLQSLQSSNSWTELFMYSLGEYLLLVAFFAKQMIDDVEEVMANLVQAYPCTIVLLLLFMACEDFRRSVINMLIAPAMLLLGVYDTFRTIVTVRSQNEASEAQSHPQESHAQPTEVLDQPAQDLGVAETENFVVPPSAEPVYATANAPDRLQNSAPFPWASNPMVDPSWFTTPPFPRDIYVNGTALMPRSDPIWRPMPVTNLPSLIPAPAALRTSRRVDNNGLPITNGVPINLEGQVLEEEREESDGDGNGNGENAEVRSHYYLPPGLLDDE